MIFMIGFWLVLIAALGIFPYIKLQQQQAITLWDYLSLFLGLVVWFLLVTIDVGRVATLSNFVIEVVVVVVISVAIPWLRWALSVRNRPVNAKWSFVLTLLPVLSSLVIRLLMPSLPE
jgi:hypothetical protein